MAKLGATSRKKLLLYSSIDQLDETSHMRSKKYDIGRISIYEDLRKLYEDGRELIYARDFENAYICLTIFRKLFVAVYRSRVYPSDLLFKYNDLDGIIESLKSELTRLYSESTRIREQKIADIRLTSTTTPVELFHFLSSVKTPVLIIDTRPRLDFDMSQMNLPLVVDNNDRKLELITYMNLPEELINDDEWKIYEKLKTVDRLMAVKFIQRHRYEYYVIFDQDSKFDELTEDSKLMMLKIVLWNGTLNEPIILDGGWDAWITGMNEFVTFKTPPPPIQPDYRPVDDSKYLVITDWGDTDKSKTRSEDPESIKKDGRSKSEIVWKQINASSDENSDYDTGEARSTKKSPKVHNSASQNSHLLKRVSLDDLEPEFGNIRAGLTGIRNIGNSCFINSIIQCLASVDLVVRYFTNDEYKVHLNRTNPLGHNGQMAEEFALVLKAMWSGHYRSISPLRLPHLLGSFATGCQHDAQEFLVFLLDGLHEDLNRADRRISNNTGEKGLNDQQLAKLSWENHLINNDSIIVHNFQDCLEMYRQPEVISGESKWMCPKCKTHQEANKKIDIWRLPSILIVHLKRFRYNNWSRKKIRTHVNFPINNLHMTDFVHDYAGSNLTYRLFAVSNHLGSTEVGHYTALCRHLELDQWYLFDDSVVVEVDNRGSIVTNQAYILFYSRLN